jgi:hypothetical protein
MRALIAPLALAASLALPLSAQQARFVKVDIFSPTMAKHAQARHNDGPSEIHARFPISLAQGALDMAGEGEIKVNGESKHGMKPDELKKLLAGAKAGDLLLEITTNKGDIVRITVE